MLTHIHIRDFAIIEELELELLPGMTALTGETGAGKSILLDALGLVLGDKADSSTVRHGAKKAEITLTVDIKAIPEAGDWLVTHELSQEENAEECILRRVITAAGKSRATINGTPVTLTLIRELGEQLVDIHGQHEHQSLMKKDKQRQMLDEFAGNEKLLADTKTSYQAWKTLKDRLHQLTTDNQQHLQRLDLLKFQVQELEELALNPNELGQLDEELNRLANAEQLLSVSEHAYQELYDAEASLYSLLNQHLQNIDSLTGADETLKAPAELLNNAQIQLQEAAYLLRDYVQDLDIDPKRLQWVEDRISDIRSMARKHRVEPGELDIYLESLQAELNTLDSDEYKLEHIREQLDAADARYQKSAQKLTSSRQQAARKLATEVSKTMQQLGMQGGAFAIDLGNGNSDYSPQGWDQIEFQVSANPGQPLKSLTKVASGGELSRISLAIQMIAAQTLTLPSLVFDEVDSGIGGGIAEVVGTQLRSLSRNRQVLCVTHLPQVASQSHQHLLVRKFKAASRTSTTIQQLDNNKRLEEIARMIGGVEITEATLTLAAEMLETS